MDPFGLVSNFYEALCVRPLEVAKYFTGDSSFAFCGDLNYHWVAFGSLDISRQLANTFNDGTYECVIKSKDSYSRANEARQLIVIKGLFRIKKLIGNRTTIRNFIHIFLQDNAETERFSFTTLSYIAPNCDGNPMTYAEWCSNQVNRISVIPELDIETFNASKQRSQRQLWADVIKKKPLYVKDNVGSNLHVGKQLEQFGDRTDSSGQLEGCEASSETSEPLSQCDYVEPSANDDVEEWGNGPDVQPTTTKRNGGKSEPKPIWTSQHINQASYVNFEGRIEYILYVAGIPTLHANKEYLANIFGPFGQIVNIVIKVHQNGAYAFLEYRNKNSVSRALELAGDSHRYYYADRYLIVDSYKKNVYCKST